MHAVLLHETGSRVSVTMGSVSVGLEYMHACTRSNTMAGWQRAGPFQLARLIASPQEVEIQVDVVADALLGAPVQLCARQHRRPRSQRQPAQTQHTQCQIISFCMGPMPLWPMSVRAMLLESWRSSSQQRLFRHLSVSTTAVSGSRPLACTAAVAAVAHHPGLYSRCPQSSWGC